MLRHQNPPTLTQLKTRMSCSERLQYSGFDWMFYVSKWPGLEIGNSFNLDKHHPLPSTMTSLPMEGRDWDLFCWSIFGWTQNHWRWPPGAERKVLTYSWFAWALRDPCPAFWNIPMLTSQGGVLVSPAQETRAWGRLLIQPHLQALLST